MHTTNYSWISQIGRMPEWRSIVPKWLISHENNVVNSFYGTWCWRATSLGAFNAVHYIMYKRTMAIVFTQHCVYLAKWWELLVTLKSMNTCFHLYYLSTLYVINGCNANVIFINNGFHFILNHFNCHNGLGIFQFACDDALNTLWLMMSQMINCRPSHFWFSERGESIEYP